MFSRPQRPDAAVFVAARDDAYVTPESIKQLHQHWKGSEIRWVPGGHVSSYVFQRHTFCKAIQDSLQRLTRSGASPSVGTDH